MGFLHNIKNLNIGFYRPSHRFSYAEFMIILWEENIFEIHASILKNTHLIHMHTKMLWLGVRKLMGVQRYIRSSFMSIFDRLCAQKSLCCPWWMVCKINFTLQNERSTVIFSKIKFFKPYITVACKIALLIILMTILALFEPVPMDFWSF